MDNPFDKIGRLYHTGQKMWHRMSVHTQIFTEESRHRVEELVGGTRPRARDSQSGLNRLTLSSLLGKDGLQVVQTVASTVVSTIVAPVAWTDDMLGHRVAILGETRKRLSELAHELEHPEDLVPSDGAGAMARDSGYVPAAEDRIRSAAVPSSGQAAGAQPPVGAEQAMPSGERRKTYDRRKFSRPGSGRRESDRAADLMATMRASFEQPRAVEPEPARAEAVPTPAEVEMVREIVATGGVAVELQRPVEEVAGPLSEPVSASVAEILAAKEERLAIPNYDQLNVHKIIDALRRVKPEEVPRLLAYEQTHKNRRSVIDAMQRIMFRSQGPKA